MASIPISLPFYEEVLDFLASGPTSNKHGGSDLLLTFAFIREIPENLLVNTCIG